MSILPRSPATLKSENHYHLTVTSPQTSSPTPGHCSLVVCHGCCCARDGKARSIEALILLEELRDACGPEVLITTSQCLGPCSEADVVVVRPSRSARGRGGGLMWLRWMRDPDAFRDLADWATAGGPGTARMPASLARREFSPPKPQAATRRNRRSRSPGTRAG